MANAVQLLKSCVFFFKKNIFLIAILKYRFLRFQIARFKNTISNNSFSTIWFKISLFVYKITISNISSVSNLSPFKKINKFCLKWALSIARKGNPLVLFFFFFALNELCLLQERGGWNNSSED
jgi:hypothetical protein